MSTILLIAAALAWVAAGSVYARRRAADEYQYRAAVGCPDLTALSSDGHDRGCGLRGYGRDNKCSCTKQEDYYQALAAERRWDALTKKPIVGANYFHVLLWPIYLHRAFLLADAGQESRRDRRRRHELENARHIAEVTSILEGNQRSLSTLDIIDEAMADVNEAGL